MPNTRLNIVAVAVDPEDFNIFDIGAEFKVDSALCKVQVLTPRASEPQREVRAQHSMISV